MAKVKPGKPRKLFSPFLVSSAASAGWASLHEPATFTNPAVTGAWLLAALAAGLIVRATLALLMPLVGLCVESVRLLLMNSSAPNQESTDP
ncbi:hypothetical protein [Acidocella sp.]|uniref:hypothetical protein n=1 Tax=Acidocella sp. TaxID=50710 RepID=UPI003D049E25